MKISILIFCLSFCIIGCNNTNEKSSDQNLNQDSLKAISIAIDALRKDIKTSYDSVKVYKLIPLNEKCIKMLYIVYGRDTLKNGPTDYPEKTIDECNICLIRFIPISSNVKAMGYDIFIDDSIPLIWRYRDRLLNFVDAFHVNIENKTLTSAHSSDDATIKIKDLEQASDSIMKSEAFRNYIKNSFQKLHPTFKSLLKI